MTRRPDTPASRPVARAQLTIGEHLAREADRETDDEHVRREAAAVALEVRRLDEHDDEVTS